MNDKEKLEKYFEFFILNSGVDNWGWYKSLEEWSDILQNIKEKYQEDEKKSLEECIKDGSNGELTNVEDFLERYLFKRANGIASIGQGNLYNIHRDEIKKLNNLEELIIDILKARNAIEANEKIEELFKEADIHSRPAVQYRFLAGLFPKEMTTIASSNMFYRLINTLNNKLSINVQGSNLIEKHQWLMQQLDDIKTVEGRDVNAYHKQIFYWELYNMLESEFNLKKAVVYYGAPGTGKTYKAKKEAQKFIERWALKNFTTIEKPIIETMQFHPSISYEDFIEGIRPTKDKALELKDGVFKSFCKKAGEIEFKLWNNEAFREIAEDKNFEDITVADIKNIDNIKDIFSKIDEYADSLTLQDIIEPAFFIIDEINRADLSRVFGELMYALEYRGYSGKIKTQYSYLVEKEEDSGVYFWE
ncbi:MAG: AAA domain-containing protein, partial [Epsilonproteobacteria bacterium]|nr:AAA domain-containing protein [Campylobacterota bacterium]